MDAGDIIAGYAAVVATSVFVWNVRNRRKARETDVRVTCRFRTSDDDSSHLDAMVVATNHGETEEYVESMGLVTWGQRRYYYGRVSVGEDVERDLLPNRNVKVTFNTAELPPSPIGPLFRGYAVLATGHFIESDVGAFSDVGSPEQLATFLADHGPITEGPMPDFPTTGQATSTRAPRTGGAG